MLKANNGKRLRIAMVMMVVGMACGWATAQSEEKPQPANKTVRPGMSAKTSEATSSPSAREHAVRGRPDSSEELHIFSDAPRVRRFLYEPPRRQFERELDAASSGTAEVAKQHLEELSNTIAKRIHALDETLAKVRASLEKAQGDERRADRSRIEWLEKQRQLELEKLRLVETRLAQLRSEMTAAAGEGTTQPISAPRLGVLGFFRDRALDLCDLFRFRFHIPRGYRSIGLKARATCLAQAGFIYFDGKNAGLDRRGVGVWREKRLEGGLGPVYFSKVADEMIAGNRYTDMRCPWSRLYRRGIVRNGVFWDDGRSHPLSCGFEFHLFIFGVECETYPLEWLDAVIGWVGLDSANDDESRLARQWYEWQTIPELKVRDEWQEKFTPPKNISPPAEEKTAPLAKQKPPTSEEPLEPKKTEQEQEK